MPEENGRAERALRHALLGLALVAVAFATMRIHWDADAGTWRDRPIHLDEYLHWGMAATVERTGGLAFDDPFVGTRAESFDVSTQLHERGFHAYLAAFRMATGVEWSTLFAFGPTVVALLLALSVYVVADRWNAGPYAALCVAAIPTTLRFLGPGFLVPIVLGVALLLVAVDALFEDEGSGRFAVAGILAASLWSIHAVAAVVLVGFVVLLALVRARGTTGSALAAAGVVLLPAIVAWPFLSRLSADGFLPAATLDPGLPVLREYGAWLLLAAAGGAAWLVASPRTRPAGVVLGGSLVVAEVILTARVRYGVDPFLLYDRAVFVGLVVACILAGTLAARAGALRVPARWARFRLAPLVASAVVLMVLVGGAVAKQSTEAYYEVVPAGQLGAWAAVGDQARAAGGRALVDGLGTMGFTAVTGIPTLYVQYPSSGAPPAEIERFFAEGSRDTYLLVATGTKIVVTTRPVENPDLVALGGGVYSLSPDILKRMPRSPQP